MPCLSHRRHRPTLRWIRLLLFTLGTAALGNVGYSLVDARVFQANENFRLNQRVNDSHQALASARALDIPADPSVFRARARSRFAPGTALGRIEISRLDVAVIIAEGTDAETLQRAVGHVTGTALPGEPGNVALAGHRDTFFRALRNIREQDEITLITVSGSYRYQVDWTKVVAPEDVGVLNDYGGSILTLVTCYPFYYVGSAPNRFIVRAHRI